MAYNKQIANDLKDIVKVLSKVGEQLTVPELVHDTKLPVNRVEEAVHAGYKQGTLRKNWPNFVELI